MAGVVEYEFLNCSSMLNQANLAIMVAVVFLLQILVIMSSLHLVGQLAEWGLIVIWNIAGKTTFIDEYFSVLFCLLAGIHDTGICLLGILPNGFGYISCQFLGGGGKRTKSIFPFRRCGRNVWSALRFIGLFG